MSIDTELLTFDEADAEAISDWLQGVAEGYDPALPEGAWELHTWAHENEAAWPMVKVPKGMSRAQARAAMDAQARTEPKRVVSESEVASAFHQRGKHDQRSHGRRRGIGGLPEGWEEVSPADYKAAKVEQRVADGMAREVAEVVTDQFTPDGVRIYRSGKNMVVVSPVTEGFDGNPIAEEDLGNIMSGVDDLQSRFPLKGGGGATVFVEDQMSMNIKGRFALGMTWRGDPMGEISLADTAVSMSPQLAKIRANQMGPSYGTAPHEIALGVLTHEWGHARDTTLPLDAQALYDDAKISGTTTLSSDPYEAIAEAFVEHVRVPSDEQLPSTKMYAEMLGWETP